MAQLLWGGLGTSYFTMDYSFAPFRELAIFKDDPSSLLACLRPRRDRFSLIKSPLRRETGVQRDPPGPQKPAYSRGKTVIIINADTCNYRRCFEPLGALWGARRRSRTELEPCGRTRIRSKDSLESLDSPLGPHEPQRRPPPRGFNEP